MRHFISFGFITAQEPLHFFNRINTNLLETNILNICILIGLFLYANKLTFLPLLEKRKIEILGQIECAQEDVEKALNYFSFIEKRFYETTLWVQLLRNACIEEKISTSKRKCNMLKVTFSNNFLITESLISNYEKRAFISLQKYVLVLTVSKLVKKFAVLSEKEQLKFFEQALLKLKKGKANEL